MKYLRAFLAGLFSIWLALAPAVGMLQNNELTGFNVGGAPPVLTRTGGTTCTNDATNYAATCTGGDLTAVATGTAAADRYTCAAVAGGATANRTISSVTLGGNAMTEVAQTVTGTEGPSGIFCLANPTGTTSAIVINFSSSMVRAYVEVYSLTGLASTTAVDTDVANGSGTNSSTLTFDVSAGGAAIAIGAKRINGTAAWTGTAGLTENDDTALEAATTATTAIGSNLAAISSGTAIVTWSAATNTHSAAAASWR